MTIPRIMELKEENEIDRLEKIFVNPDIDNEHR